MKEHPIRSRNYHFVNATLGQLYEPVRKQVEQEFFDDLLNNVDLLNYFNDKYKMVYTKYVKLRKNMDTLVE